MDEYYQLSQDYESLKRYCELKDIELHRLKQLLKKRNNQLYRIRKQLKELECSLPSKSTT